jgi:hypothetical protein
VSARDVARKEPVFWLFHSPPVTQDLQWFWREHHIPILLSLALLDTQDHALAVDRGRRERNGLGDALRRGLATTTTSVDSQLAAKSLLRHASIQTTAQHYIKSVPAEAVRAVDKINSLFDNTNSSSRPN